MFICSVVEILKGGGRCLITYINLNFNLYIYIYIYIYISPALIAIIAMKLSAMCPLKFEIKGLLYI